VTPRQDNERGRTQTASDYGQSHRLPTLLTPSDVATLLRTSKKAVYAMIERGQLPGVVRIGRRVLVRQDSLVDWLGQKSQTPSPKG
jgi:excisionase family DNA binding protein